MHASHFHPPPRRRVRRLAVSALTCALAVTALPASSAEPLPGVVAPFAVQVGDDTSRFVTLWDARFRSGAAFQAYLDSDQQYDDGYNGRRPEEQAMLVRALVGHWRATDPGFAEYVDWTPTPEGEPVVDEGRERPNVDQVLTIVDAIIFHKEKFKAALRGEDEGTGVETPGEAPEAPNEATPADPLGEQAVAALLGVLETAQAALDATSVKISPEVLAPVASQLENVPAQQVLDRLPTSGDIAGVDLVDLGTEAPFRITDTNAAAGVEIPSVNAGLTLGPDNLVYGACWETATSSETCTPLQYVVGVAGIPTLPGQSAGIDVDNSLFTGNVLGHDLELSLVVDPLTTPGGLGAAVSVKRHGTVAANAKGVVRYLLPGSDKEVRIGFDGRTAGLQATQTAGALIEDVNALSTGEVRLKATVSHDGTPGVPTVGLVTDFAGTATPDWFQGTTSFVRAPAAHTVRMVFKRSGSTGLVRVESTHSSATLPDIRVQATGRLGTAAVTGTVAFTEVPTSTVVNAVSDDATNATNVTYTSTSQLKRLQAGVVVAPNASVPGNRYLATLDLHRLPTQITGLSVGHGQVGYSANGSISAATGLGFEASLEEQVGGVTRRRAYVGLSNAPTSVAVTRTAGTHKYVVNSGAGIGQALASYYDTTQQLNASLTIAGFPGHAELTLPTSSDPRIAWSASAPTTSVSASATFGVWSAGLTVNNVPASMSIVPGTTAFDVTATGGAPASVQAYLTNTGTYATSPYAGDNYATLTWRKLSTPQAYPAGTVTTQVSGALRMTGITKVRVTPGPATTFDLKAGGGAPLYVLARLEDQPANTRRYAQARLVNFPGNVTGSIGSTTTISANANSDLSAYVESGPLLNTPGIPAPHGVFYRRFMSTAGVVHKGSVWLTGLPTTATFAPGSIHLGGLRPSQPTLTAQVELLDNAAAPTIASATLSGIPVGVPHTVTVSWSTAQVPGGYKTTAQATTSGSTFGALTVNLVYDRYSAYLTTSALPPSIKATVTEVEGQTTFDWVASAVLASINAGFQTRPSPTATWNARGSVALTDIPSQFTLTAGRDPSGSGPLVTYTSNGSAALDAEVVADGSLKTSSTTVGANLYFRLVNLAKTVSVSKLNAGFKTTGSGRTSRIEAKVSGRVSLSKSGSGTYQPAGWVKFPWSYDVQVGAVVKNLSVVLTDVGAFEADLSLVSRLAGDYGTFHLSWEQLGVSVNARGELDAVLDLWVCQCKFDIVTASLSFATNLNPSVRLYQEAWQTIFSTRVYFFCSYLDFSVKTRPQPIATVPLVKNASYPSGGINLYGTIGSWRTNWATPVLFGWNLLSDVVTGISVYGGGFVSASSYAKWTCW